MSKAYNVGVKIGSLLRDLFVKKDLKKIEPVMSFPDTDIDKIKLFVDDRTFLENEIKECSGYQKTWHLKLYCAYFNSYGIKSADDIPDPIRDAFYALKTNDEYLEATFEKLEAHVLTQLEVEGFPKVRELVDRIKKECKTRG